MTVNGSPARPPASPHLPRLRYRPMRATDLPECLALLPDSAGLTPTQKARMPELWARLVGEPSILAGVIEDTALPEGERLQGWGVTMVLPSTMVKALHLETNPGAYVARRVYAALLAGELQPPSDREIGLLNASGELVLLILHYSMRHNDYFDPYISKVIATANDAFRAFHDGYNLRAIFYENSAAAEPVARTSGFDTHRLADHDALQVLAPEVRPALYSLTREAARQRVPGTPARNCFEHQPPRFRLNASQRRLLWLALFDDSDETLMAQLEVSTHGLKKLWRGIYDRIADTADDFFGDSPGEDDGKRGPEKRRQVLAYVRQRMEELRPWVAGG